METGGKAIMVLFWGVTLMVMVVIMVLASPLLVYEACNKKRMQRKYL